MNKTLLFAIIAVIAIAVIGVIVSSGSKTQTDKKAATQTIETSTTGSTADVSTHKTESDCWTRINGRVYNITAYFGSHPGGDRRLLQACGIDASTMFNTQDGRGSHSSDAIQLLSTFEVK